MGCQSRSECFEAVWGWFTGFEFGVAGFEQLQGCEVFWFVINESWFRLFCFDR